MSIVSGARAGIAAAAVAAIVVLAGCGGSANDALPLIRATIMVKTVSMGGVCDTVPVRITPKELRGEANKYANNQMLVAEIPTTGPTDENGAPMCNGQGESLPLAPGVWEFSAPLRSDTYKCERDIQELGDLDIVFIDGVEGCGGPPSAAEMSEATVGEPGEDELPAGEGEAAEEGDAPAEGEAPAPGN